VSSLLSVVDRGARVAPEARDAVFLAVIDEVRRDQDSLWPSVLLVAFAPLLIRHRARMRRPRCEDLDQRVIVAFLDAARDVRDAKFVPRQIELGLRRRLFAEGGREHRGRDALPFDEETYAVDLFGKDEDRKVLAAETLRALEVRCGEALCDVLLERCATGESFRAYVDRKHSALPPRERARLCARMSRAEDAALRTLRRRAERVERRYALAG
jgi:hypothetical protein